MERRIFHIDLDAFFVAVERARDPSLEGRPVVVGGDPDSRGVVACASYEARPYGLRAGMPLSTARRLCPQAVFLAGHFHHYQEVSERFLELLRGYTPLMEPLGLDEAYLDMTGFQLLYGPPRGVAQAIRARIGQELQVTASIGIASSKVVAKVASDLCKPDGLLEVAAGEEAGFLAPLLVERLPGVGPKASELLHRQGIGTVGELAQVPAVALRRTFGAWGDLLHLWARGEDHGQVSLPAPAKSISRETTFPRDTADRPFLLATLCYLVERVGAELREEGKRARCVTVKVRYGDFFTVTRQQSLQEPLCNDRDLFGTGARLLLRALKERRDRVRLIGIGVSGLVGGGEQLPLLESATHRFEQLSRVLDRVRRKYGFTALQTGRTLLLGDHFPVEHRGFILKTPALSR